MSKNVYEYSVTGELINNYSSQVEAAVNHGDYKYEANIRNAIKNNTLWNGRYWSNKAKKIMIDKRILVIGDVHAPFTIDNYLEFCYEIYYKYNCNEVIFTGDVLDNHYQSFHNTDPDGHSAAQELKMAKADIAKWHSLFPNAKVCLGNHDCYDAKTEILTENGWIKGIDLNSNIKVGTMDLETGGFEYQLPTEIIKKSYSGELVEYKNSDTVDLLVTPGHRMIYSEKIEGINTRHYKITPAIKLQKGYKYFPVSCENLIEEPILYTNEEIKLLAWIASDGSVLKNNRFAIYQSKLNGIKEIESVLDILDIKYTKRTRKRDTKSINGVTLKNEPLDSAEYYFLYKAFSEYTDKYKLPDCVYRFNSSQFNVFINSFIDGDGSRKYDENGVSKDGCMIYGVKSILDQLQTLCVMNNTKTSITEYRENDFRLNILFNKKNVGFSTHRATTKHYEGLVWCATVPNSTLIVRRNDKVQIQGNCLPNRKAFSSGISKQWIKSIGDVLETPTWEYAEEFVIDGVLYCHGVGRKAWTRMKNDLISVVQGHYHSESYIRYSNGRNDRLFAVQIGCGVDIESYAMAYGKHFDKPHINCGVILDNGKLPILEYM